MTSGTYSTTGTTVTMIDSTGSQPAQYCATPTSLTLISKGMTAMGVTAMKDSLGVTDANGSTIMVLTRE